LDWNKLISRIITKLDEPAEIPKKISVFSRHRRVTERFSTVFHLFGIGLSIEYDCKRVNHHKKRTTSLQKPGAPWLPAAVFPTLGRATTVIPVIGRGPVSASGLFERRNKI
jgi:hypothetical protein